MLKPILFSFLFLAIIPLFLIQGEEVLKQMDLEEMHLQAHELASTNYLFTKHASSDLIYQGYIVENSKTHITYKFFVKENTSLPQQVVAFTLKYTFEEELMHVTATEITRK